MAKDAAPNVQVCTNVGPNLDVLVNFGPNLGPSLLGELGGQKAWSKFGPTWVLPKVGSKFVPTSDLFLFFCTTPCKMPPNVLQIIS